MKKSTFLFFIITILSGAIFYTCNKDKKDTQCKSCESENYSLIKSKIVGTDMVFKNFQSDNKSSLHVTNYMYANSDSKTLKMITSSLGVENYVGSANIVSMVYYLKDKVSDNFELKRENLSGVLIYLSDNSSFYTKLISFEATQQNIDLYSTTTSVISINDIYVVASNVFSNSNIRTITQINNNDVNEIKPSLPKFSYLLKKLQRNTTQLTTRAEGGCSSPCASQPGGCCKMIVAYNWWNVGCYACCIKVMDDILDNAIAQGAINALGFNYNEDGNVLKSFKYDYLDNTLKGEAYLIKLEYLTTEFCKERSQPSIQYCLNSAIFFHNTVLPIISKLTTNSTSSEILYNDSQKTEIVSYLESFKTFYSDEMSINIINSLINDINSNSNKSIADVKAFLNS